MSTTPYTNELIHESSPYLLQHAHNPVHWMPWGDKAWSKARAEDKLVIVSIGYSACHWCHVMEHESFEDTSVANLMNDHFICIKVDREERPDVDQIYMDAVQIITGRGGWPLNAICLPDGHPVYAGTYFQRENWKQVLAYLHDHYMHQRAELEDQAAQITHGIKVMDTIPFVTDTTFQVSDRTAMIDSMTSSWDFALGGRQGAPKFPMPATLACLLRFYHYTHQPRVLEAVTVTLDHMMYGGIYDQVGGGFARYSVDSEWTIPHFEKMLYDNAQLVSVYSDAYGLTGNLEYKRIVYETLAYIQREMTDPSGAFYSAIDADSEGEEGRFYVWKYEALKEIIGADFEQFCAYYEVSPQGNFEHQTINLRLRSDAKIQPSTDKLNHWKKLLLDQRSKRVRPGLDDKSLTAWNALMLKGYADAYRAFGDPQFLQYAIKNANFIRSHCIKKDHSIYRNYKNGKSTINGFLDDYAFTADAYIALYLVTFDEQWLREARLLADHVVAHFYSKDKGCFYYTSITDDPLIARKTETSDNVIPSSNSAMATVLYKLGHIYDQPDYLVISRQQMMNMKETTLRYTPFYANWAMLMDWYIDSPYELVIIGPDAAKMRDELGRAFLPDCLMMGAPGSSDLPLLKDKYSEGKTLIYICKDKTCGLPLHSVAEAKAQLKR